MSILIREDTDMAGYGMIAAVEMQAVKERYGDALKSYQLAGREAGDYLIGGKTVTVVHSGAGEIAAAAAAQALIDKGAEVILNFGVVGALTPEAEASRLCVVDRIIHYDFDTSEADHSGVGRYLELPSVWIPTDDHLRDAALSAYPQMKTVNCASGDKFIGDPDKKRKLAEEFHCDICEMESAGIALTCWRNNVPCLLIKMVSDGIEGGAEEFYVTFRTASAKALEVMEEVLKNL